MSSMTPLQLQAMEARIISTYLKLRKRHDMRESTIEKYLVDQVKKHGGVAEKFKSPGRKNVPDRIVLWPTRKYFCDGYHAYVEPDIHFIELKATGKKATVAQERDHKWRREMGFLVLVLDSKEGVDIYIKANAPRG